MKVPQRLSLLDFPGPVITCLNGPAYHHAEIALLGDIILAADDTVISARGHLARGTVPGYGPAVILPLMMGLNRYRYYQLMEEELDAQELLSFGLVNEVMPREDLAKRASEIADRLAGANPLTLRYTRQVLVMHLKSLLGELQRPGHTLQQIAALGPQVQG
jgi:enoyl-CoA hydratase/carnithine racemase